MTRGFRWAALACLVGVVVPAGAQDLPAGTVAAARPMALTSLPPEVHATFLNTLVRAEEAARKSDWQQALAMTEGVLYPDGVTVRLEMPRDAEHTAAWNRAFIRGVQMWKDALGEDCPIRVVPAGQPAEVVVRLVDEIPNWSHDAMGLIELEKSYRWNRVKRTVKNEGRISILREYEGRLLGEDRWTEVIGHELGHLLGLADVDYVGHLMGPLVWNAPTLNPLPHEVRAVRLLRAAARDRWNSYTQSARAAQRVSAGSPQELAFLSVRESAQSGTIPISTEVPHGQSDIYHLVDTGGSPAP